MALSDNLVAYWSLDEASGNAIDAHDDNDLTDTNTVGSTTGKVNGCRDFEGSDFEYFTIADNADLSTGNIDFTFNCWVQLEDTADARSIIGKWNIAGATAEYRLRTTPSRFQFQVTADGETSVVVTANTFGAPSGSTWYMVTCWHDSVNNLIGIAVNAGTADTTSHSTGVLNGTSNFQLGNSGTANNAWDGKIDEVGFWKRVLTSDERTELYNSGNGRDYAYITGGGAVNVGRGRLQSRKLARYQLVG